jgi:two-component system NtrC family sensor kinase
VAPWRYLATIIGRDQFPFLSGSERFTTEFSIGGRDIQLSIRLIAPQASRDKIFILSDITDRKLAEYAVRTAEKLAATGKLAHAIAHEINNPLEALTNLIYLARTSTNMDFVQKLLKDAGAELDRVGRITKQTLAFHRDTQFPTQVDIAKLLSDVIAIYSRPSSAKQVHLVLDAMPAPPVRGYPGQLTQVFSNLVRNALEASPPNSSVVVRVRAAERRGSRGLRVAIHDRGAGIPHDVRTRMFDPFFTTKELKGSGLGLWVSKGLVAGHHGEIRFRSSERVGSSGTTFEVFLPGELISAAVESQDALCKTDAS